MTRPLILLHGWTMHGAVFDPLIARLGPGFAARAPDLPGHGAACGQPGNLEASAEMLAGLIKDNGRRDTLLLGWSMGAAVAWTYLANHGSKGLAGLVTIDMAPKLVNAPDWQAGLLGQSPERLRHSQAEMRTDWPTAGRKIARTMFASRDGGTDLSRADAERQVLGNDPARMTPWWDRMLAMDLRPGIAAIDIPWLVVHGAKSRVYPQAAAEWLAATAPNARRLGFAGSGHSAHLEEPEAFCAVFNDFAASL